MLYSCIFCIFPPKSYCLQDLYAFIITLLDDLNWFSLLSIIYSYVVWFVNCVLIWMLPLACGFYGIVAQIAKPSSGGPALWPTPYPGTGSLATHTVRSMYNHTHWRIIITPLFCDTVKKNLRTGTNFVSVGAVVLGFGARRMNRTRFHVYHDLYN